MNLSEIYKIARDIYSGKTLHGFNGYVTFNDDILSIVFKKIIFTTYLMLLDAIYCILFE